MKRRKFLIGLPLLTGGMMLAYSTFKWTSWNKTPDIAFLHQSLPLLASLTDTILPKTDTPSASECAVPEFIIQAITACADIRSQNQFINGLKDIDTYAVATYKKTFPTCTEEERLAMLKYFDEKDEVREGRAGRVQAFFTGKPFTLSLKEYCIIGYFTSEQGATHALRYAHVPGSYMSCEPYHAGERAWATR